MQTKEKRSKKQTIYDLIKKAEEKESELSCAIQNVERNLVYHGFTDKEPSASMCSGGEFILEYQGREIDANGVVTLMAQRGYINPDDFI